MHPTEGVINNANIVYQNIVYIVNTKFDKNINSLSRKVDYFLCSGGIDISSLILDIVKSNG